MQYLKSLLFTLLFLFTTTGFACSCKTFKPLSRMQKVSYELSEIIFSGELIEFNQEEGTYTFRITELFKGKPKSTILKGKYHDSCSLFPNNKSKWIVYANLKENDLINISQCLGSRSYDDPLCIGCYNIPPPPAENQPYDFKSKMVELTPKAKKDWLEEIEILRVKKNKKPFTSIALRNNFNEAEIRDLSKMVDFFKGEFCSEKETFKTCMDSLMPYLCEYGDHEIITNVDFKRQSKLYEELESELFTEIWRFYKTKYRLEEKRYRSIGLKIDSKYIRFIKELSLKNPKVEKYYNELLNYGHFDGTSQIQYDIRDKPQFFDLNDPNVQALLTINFLTKNDFYKRRELWVEE